jgi:hypothetical protein
MKVLSRDVHRILRKEVGAVLQPLGFRTLSGAQFSASRSEGDRYLTLWSQCDKHGWEADWGCSFTIELQFSQSEFPADGGILERVRVPHLLSAECREAVRIRNNEIIKELPGFLGRRMVSVRESDGNEVVVLGYVPTDNPHPLGVDVWFHYASHEHVEQWAKFIAERLPACFGKFRAGKS